MSEAGSDSAPHAPGKSAIGGSGLLVAARRLIPFLCFRRPAGAIPARSRSSSHGATSQRNVAFWDFHAFWRAGHAVLHGRSPYPPASAAVLAHEKSFVYPAPAAVAMVPFALLPYRLAATLFALVLVASIPIGLRLVGVRDWRCYGVALVSAPFANSLAVAAVSPILALGLALVWRYRDRMAPAACAVAALVVLKLFLWPLLLWFAFTRRLTTAVVAVALIAVTSLVSWAAIGFDGFRAYPDVLRILTRLLEGKGYTLVALGLSLGAGRDPVAEALSVARGRAGARGYRLPRAPTGRRRVVVRRRHGCSPGPHPDRLAALLRAGVRPDRARAPTPLVALGRSARALDPRRAEHPAPDLGQAGERKRPCTHSQCRRLAEDRLRRRRRHVRFRRASPGSR